MSESIPPISAPKAGRAGWFVVAALLLLQFGLFRQFVAREVAPMVPRGHDQTAYLSQTYRLYERALDQGFWDSVRQGWLESGPTGVLMPLQGVAALFTLGPSRQSAMTPHFLYFAGFQCLLVALALRWTGRWDVAFFALGLCLTATAPVQPIGGLTDYRIDSLAFSLYGALVGLCLASDGFASRRWAVAVGAAAGVLILFRHLTVVYLAGIGTPWLALMLARLVLARRDDAARAEAIRRLGNFLLAAAIIAAVSLAAVAPKWRSLWAYYGVGHLTGPEKHVRAAEFGVHTTADSLLYYARSVWYDQAGWLFFVVAGLGMAATVWFRLRHPRQVGADAPRSLAAVALVALALFVPWLVLTASVSKSPVVGNLLVMPLLWLAVLAVARTAPARGRSRVLRVLSLFALAAGTFTLVGGYCKRSAIHDLPAEDREQLLALHDDLARHAVESGWVAPVVSLDQVVDFLPPLTQAVPAYERLGVLLDVKPTALGGSIFEFEDQLALREVQASHFVLLTDGESLTNPCYPVTRSFDRVRPLLRDYCRQNLQMLGTYQVMGRRIDLYARPSLRPSVKPQQWVTSAGLRLSGRAEELRTGARVRLSGKGARSLLPRPPRAEILVGSGPTRKTIPARLSFPTHDEYTLEFEIPADLPLGDGRVEMLVRFDTHFVPRDLGMNDDVRELVVFGPSQIELHRRGDVGMTGALDQPRHAEGE